jgi:hypothetical protein
MRFRVAEQHRLSNAHSPFRVIEQSGREVTWTIDSSTSSESAAWLIPHCVATRMTYSTSSVDGQRRIRRMLSPKRRSPSPHSSTIFAARSTRIPRRRPPALTVESEPSSGRSAVSSPTPLLCLHPAFSTGTGGNHGWAMDGSVPRSLSCGLRRPNS